MFADRLFLYNHSIDDGTAFRIHHLLLDVATLRGDRDMRIRELYYVGITLQYMKICCSDLNLFALLDEVRAAFDAAAEYMAVYEEIESEQTRSFIVRSLANRKLGLDRTSKSFDEYDKLFTEAMVVIMSPKYRSMNPNLPWDAFEYSMHADRTGLVDALRFCDDPKRAQQVLISARYIYEHTEEHERNNDRFTSSSVSYIYAAARYHAGEITLHALLSTLYELYERADWSDYSDKGLVFFPFTLYETIAHFEFLNFALSGFIVLIETTVPVVRRYGEIVERKSKFRLSALIMSGRINGEAIIITAKANFVFSYPNLYCTGR